MVWAFDLRRFATGTAAVAIAASALATFSVLLFTTFVIRTRSVRIIGSLRQPTATGDARPPNSDSPADCQPGSLEDSQPGRKKGTISENVAEDTTRRKPDLTASPIGRTSP